MCTGCGWWQGNCACARTASGKGGISGTEGLWRYAGAEYPCGTADTAYPYGCHDA